MTTITEYDLATFKSVHPANETIQALTLDEVNANVRDKAVDWNAVELRAETPVAVTSVLSDCQMAVGCVIYDLVCEAIGAVSLRAAASSTTVEAVAHAAAPVMPRIARIIAKMETGSRRDRAYGGYHILATLYSGACLGAVVSALTASLAWWNMVLYGITAVGTIVAKLDTDGLAFVAQADRAVHLWLARIGAGEGSADLGPASCQVGSARKLGSRSEQWPHLPARGRCTALRSQHGEL